MLLEIMKKRHNAIHEQHYDDSDLSRASLYELLKITPPENRKTELVYSWLEKENTKKNT